MQTSFMQPTAGRFRTRARAAVMAGMLIVTGTLTACENFLTAENPSAVPVERLTDSALVDLMGNSAIAGVQGTTFWYTWLGSIFTDELRNTHVFIDEILYDRRDVTVANSYNSVFTYGPIARARWLADSLAGRMVAILGDSSQHDIRVARTYAMAGIHLLRLAEGFCEVPVPVGGEAYAPLIKSDSVFKIAEARFAEAIRIAEAAKPRNATAGGTLGTRYALGADSIRNLALVGMARAALNRNDKAKALTYARQVTGLGTTNDFRYWAYFNATTTLGLSNLFAERLAGGSGVTSGAISGTPYVGLDDARVPHPINPTTGAPAPEGTQSGQQVVPNSPRAFSTFDGTKTGADPTYGTAIELASLLEARYIIAEAEGPTAASIAFLESRRAAFPSSTATTPATAANFMTILIQQRSRDFYLSGHRMGDLRRWKKYYNIDLYPTGSYLGSSTVSYSPNVCWPINQPEVTNNPLVPKPYEPPVTVP